MRLKSINNIFKTNLDLLDEPEVIELIEYCESLQSTIIEYEQQIDKTIQLKQLVSEIKESASNLIEQKELHDRWPSEFGYPDFEKSIINLKQYITDYCKDNKIYL